MSEKPPTEQAQLETALARERERSRALREVGLLLDSTVPRDELLRRVLAAAAKVTEAERATLYLLDEGGKTLTSHVMEGGGEVPIVLQVGEGIAGAAARERRSIGAPDAYGHPRFDRAWDQKTGFRTRSVLASPMLKQDGSLLGVVQVLNRRDGGTFDPDDVAMLEALSAQAAVAIEGARRLEDIVAQNRALTDLRERLERALRERNLLLEIEQLLARAETLDAFLGGALAGLLRECDAGAGAVLLAETPGAPLLVRVAMGEGSEGYAGTIASPETLAGRAAAGEFGPTQVQGRAEPNEADSVLVRAARAKSLLVAPLPGEHGPVGAIELRDGKHGMFNAIDEDLLMLVAANLSTGVALWDARRERERAGRLASLGRVLSNVLHDLRAPMTVISGYAQLMPGIESAERRARYAQAIVRQFEHVQAMIAEVLAFVRGESQVLVHQVLLEPFFQEVVEGLKSELEPRHVTVTLSLKELGSARFDAAKITRMVHNLARNAAEAMSSRGGGTFAISVQRDGEQLVLQFQDDGPGIPEAVLPLLFRAFVTEGKPGGTGLGLPIVKKVVDEHRGTIDVETGTWGTRFTVKLPAAGPAGLAPRVARPEAEKGAAVS